MAKKLYLVDERTFKHLKTPWQNAVVDKFQEASWSKPPEKRSKTEMYRDMHNLLENVDINDDEKAKLYNQGFIRYQNTNSGAEMQQIKQEEVANVPPVAVTQPKRKRKAKATSPAYQYGEWQKISSKRKKKLVSTPLRRSSRPRKSITWEAL